MNENLETEIWDLEELKYHFPFLPASLENDIIYPNLVYIIFPNFCCHEVISIFFNTTFLSGLREKKRICIQN